MHNGVSSRRQSQEKVNGEVEEQQITYYPNNYVRLRVWLIKVSPIILIQRDKHGEVKRVTQVKQAKDHKRSYDRFGCQ